MSEATSPDAGRNPSYGYMERVREKKQAMLADMRRFVAERQKKKLTKKNV